MQDGIIKGTGNSRYLKSISNFLAQYPTYQDFAAALAAGTLPIDLNGINEAGWDQLGTALNKVNLLSDETCGIMDLENTAVPDDALNFILNYLYHEFLPHCTLINSFTTTGSESVSINLSGLSSGTYYLKIFNETVINEGAIQQIGSESNLTSSFYLQQGSGTMQTNNGQFLLHLNTVYNAVFKVVISGPNLYVYSAFASIGEIIQYARAYNANQLTVSYVGAGTNIEFWRKL